MSQPPAAVSRQRRFQAKRQWVGISPKLAARLDAIGAAFAADLGRPVRRPEVVERLVEHWEST